MRRGRDHRRLTPRASRYILWSIELRGAYRSLIQELPRVTDITDASHR